MTPAISLKLNSLKSISFNLYGRGGVLVAKQHIRDIPNSIFGDPIRNNAPWNIPYQSEQFPARNPRHCAQTARETFLTVSVLRPSVSSLGQDFQLGSRGVHAPSGWVSFYTVGTHTHTHSAPVMLGRFQPAASERSALEFLRPKEISNWVMDMVTWTMRRQRGRERRRRKRGRRRERGRGYETQYEFIIYLPSPWLTLASVSQNKLIWELKRSSGE